MVSAATFPLGNVLLIRIAPFERSCIESVEGVTRLKRDVTLSHPKIPPRCRSIFFYPTTFNRIAGMAGGCSTGLILSPSLLHVLADSPNAPRADPIQAIAMQISYVSTAPIDPCSAVGGRVRCGRATSTPCSRKPWAFEVGLPAARCGPGEPLWHPDRVSRLHARSGVQENASHRIDGKLSIASTSRRE